MFTYKDRIICVYKVKSGWFSDRIPQDKIDIWTPKIKKTETIQLTEGGMLVYTSNLIGNLVVLSILDLTNPQARVLRDKICVYDLESKKSIIHDNNGPDFSARAILAGRLVFLSNNVLQITDYSEIS